MLKTKNKLRLIEFHEEVNSGYLDFSVSNADANYDEEHVLPMHTPFRKPVPS